VQASIQYGCFHWSSRSVAVAFQEKPEFRVVDVTLDQSNCTLKHALLCQLSQILMTSVSIPIAIRCSISKQVFRFE